MVPMFFSYIHTFMYRLEDTESDLQHLSTIFGHAIFRHARCKRLKDRLTVKLAFFWLLAEGIKLRTLFVSRFIITG